MTINLKKLIAGIAIGIANIIPGVSGGTIAVVFGVYPDMIDLASLNIRTIKGKWQNFLFLILGISMGIIGFAKIFRIIYAKFPAQTNFFFIGLIVASIFIIFEMVKEEESKEKTKLKAITKSFFFVLGLLIMLFLFFTKSPQASNSVLINELNFTNILRLFFAGIAGALAMLIPGISGSFILLIMGVYYTVIKAISNFNFLYLFIIGLGVLIGLIFGARLIKFLLEKFSTITYSFILGLVVGSIVHLYPRVCQPLGLRVASAISLIVGYTIINLFEKKRR